MKDYTPPIVLSIAGSDSSGGAGIQADIKTISALGGYAATAITALTAQNTQGVRRIEPVSDEMLRQQIACVFDDLAVDAVKIGMIHNNGASHTIAEQLHHYAPKKIVCDPVMISTSGAQLMEQDTIASVVRSIFPKSTLITPNLHEASMLIRRSINGLNEMRKAAKILSDAYGCSVLIKGGHLDGDTMCDILCDEGTLYEYASPRIISNNLHGTGCTLSSAIATQLAHGDPLATAIEHAKAYVTDAIAAAASMQIGGGHGPLWHFSRFTQTPGQKAR